MPKFRNPHTSLRPESEFDKAVEEQLMRLGQQLEDILNKGIKFSENFNGQILTFTSDVTPDTEFSAAHTLGRVPAGRVILYQTKAGNLYQGPSTGTAWTATNAYFKCDVASVGFQIILF